MRGGHLRTDDARERDARGGPGLHDEAGAVPAVGAGAAVDVGVAELRQREVDRGLGTARGLDARVMVVSLALNVACCGGGQASELGLGVVVLLADLLALGVGVLLGGGELGLAVLELRATVLELLARLAELLEGVGAGAVERLDGTEAGEELVGVAAAEQVDGGPEGRVHLLLHDRVAELGLLRGCSRRGRWSMSPVMSSISACVCLACTPSWLTCSFMASASWNAALDVLGRDGGIGSGGRQGEQSTDQSECCSCGKSLTTCSGSGQAHAVLLCILDVYRVS